MTSPASSTSFEMPAQSSPPMLNSPRGACPPRFVAQVDVRRHSNPSNSFSISASKSSAQLRLDGR
jgi:hypothetical protein